MKKTVKIFRLVVLLFLFGAFATHANRISVQTNCEHKAPTLSTLFGDNLVGGWSYTVEGAPAGYEKGLLVIVKDGNGYKVQVQVGGGTLLGENVQVKGKTISFEVMVEGGRVMVNLTAKGDTITGQSTSSEGSYNINGKKTLSME